MVEDSTIEKYAVTLHGIIHGLTESLGDHRSGYIFPLKDQDERRLKALNLALSGSGDCTDALHDVVKTILDTPGRQPSTKAESLLDNITAVFMLQKEGNFKTGDLVTQFFAHLIYTGKSMMFYEGVRKSKELNISLYEFVTKCFIMYD